MVKKSFYYFAFIVDKQRIAVAKLLDLRVHS